MRRTEKRAGKPGIVVYFDKMRQNLAHLDDTQAGRLLRAMLAYGETQTEPDFTDDILLAALWERVRDDLDVDDARYSKRKNDTELKLAWGKYCGQAKADGEKPISFEEWKRRLKDDPHITAVNSQPSEPNLQSSSITPQISERVSLSRARAREDAPTGLGDGEIFSPTLDEVRAYITEQGLTFGAKDFMDYYAARGWTLEGSPVKDWRALCRRWQKREGTFSVKTKNDRNRLYTDADYAGGESII